MSRQSDAQALAAAFQRRLQVVARRSADRAQALWRTLDARDLSGSWAASVGPQLVRTVTAGKLLAAGPAQQYTSAVVTAYGQDPDPVGTLDPQGFAGTAADGRDLAGLLYLPVITSKQQLAAGLPESSALDSGLAQLVTMVASEVTDAGRSAAGVAVAADRTITGYVRMLSPPSCARCAILAGKAYHSAVAFQRHPHCDCVHVPTVRGVRPQLTDPGDYFRSLSAAEQARIFGAAGAQAIRDGADIAQIVNARRGMYAIGDLYGKSVLATREGMTRRGLARQRLNNLTGGRGTVRLMPESIYALASDRDEVLRLLYRYGYLY